MKKGTLVFAVASLLLFMSGCRANLDAGLSGSIEPSAALSETYWKLTGLMGRALNTTAQQKREAYLILKKEGWRVQGFGGCNNFTGSYELLPGSGIRFRKLASTMMACPDMESETEFFRMLEMADNYVIRGNTLQLNKARMAPLARFDAVYLK